MPIPNAWEKEAEWERPLAETKWAESHSISTATRAHCGERWVLEKGPTGLFNIAKKPKRDWPAMAAPGRRRSP